MRATIRIVIVRLLAAAFVLHGGSPCPAGGAATARTAETTPASSRAASDAPEPDATTSAPPPILRGVRRILFYGDSLTDGSSYPDYVVDTLNRLYPDADFELLNSAVAGDTAADLRKRFEEDVLRRTPDLVTICIGANDAHGKRGPDAFEADMTFLLDELRKADIGVLLIRPSPFGDAEKEKRFRRYLAVIDRLAKEKDVPTADAHGLFVTWMKKGRKVLGPDGIHHGEDGFECMARAVLKGLGLPDAEPDMIIEPWPWLLTEWETSAPVEKDGDYAPAEATDWKPYDANALSARQPWWNAPFPLRGAWMPFDDHDGKRAAYGRAVYDADEAGEYELQVGGSPDPQIVWLNGEEVWRSRRPHGFHPNADRVVVRMKKGRNEIIGVSSFMLFVGVRPLD